MRVMKMIEEEPGNVIVDAAHPVTESISSTQKRKKKNKNKDNREEEEGASLDVESSESSERQKGSSSTSAESQTTVTDNILTPKKKKKREDADEHDVSESTKRNAVEDVENHGNEMNIDESCLGTPHKKKKKKKKKASFEESVDEAQTSLVYEDGDTDGCNTNMVDDESLGTSDKKKKKKRKDLEESIDEGHTNFAGVPSLGFGKKSVFKFNFVSTNCADEENRDIEGLDTSIVHDESLGTPHKKKKKKKKDLEESIEGGHTGTDFAREENRDIEEENRDIAEENRDIEEGNRDIEGFNGSVVKSSNKKKKKRKLEDREASKDNINVFENGLCDNEMEDDENGRHVIEEGEGLMRKKKKKREEIEADENNLHESVIDPMEEEDEEQAGERLQESTLVEEEREDNGRSHDIGGFTQIDEVKEIRKGKVDRVLPEWLSHPTVVSMNLKDGVPVGHLQGVDRYFLKHLRKERIRSFFPVQAAVIPELLASSKSISMRYRPRDICISAPTGSGKTLAYVLPIIQALRSRVVPQLRALVILPTQELAIQVHNVFVKFSKLSKLKVCLAVGHHNFKKEQAALVFQDTIGDCSADILVATPGKLSDHLSFTERLSFKHLRFLVMDEADLFLSSSGGSLMVKIEQLKKRIERPVPDNSIISGGFQPSGASHLPELYLQQILVSATLMHDPEQLKVLNLHRPKLFIASNNPEGISTLEMVGPYMRPMEIREEYVTVDPTLKPLVLHHLITSHKLHSVLVFTKSTTATHTLSVVLSAMSKYYTVAQFSSKEGRRKQILKDFASNKIDVLVSSDAMARGIDISGIEQVVSYDVPSVQTYVHRIGRTGRAGKRGFALTLVEDTPESKRDFKAILNSCRDRITKIKVTEKEVTRYGEVYQQALSTLKETTLKEKKDQKLRKIKRNLERAKKLKAKKKKLNKENT